MSQPTLTSPSTLLSAVSVSAVDEGRFVVVLRDDNNVVWEINKSLQDFMELSNGLKTARPECPEIDTTSILNEKTLFEYLQQIIQLLNEDLLNVPFLVAFMDNMKVSCMTDLQLRYLKNQVSMLKTQCVHYESVIKSMDEKSAVLHSTVELLQTTYNDAYSSITSIASDSVSKPRSKKSIAKLVSVGEASDDSSSDEATSPKNGSGDFTVLYSLSSKSNFNFNVIDEIIDMLQPHENQRRYRASALGFMRKQIRVALNGTGFDVGLQELGCNLPDDPIKISVMLCKSQVTNWQKVCCDALLAAEQQIVDPAMQAFADTYYDLLEHGFQTITNHVISNTSQSSDNMSFKVNCLVDQLEVEITSNARTDLCMLAFLQEVSEFVGQNYLFKRSLILIRAWWIYETAAYVGSPVKHYLNDFSICIMVTAIFNQFHSEISHPLQALCLFLSEYSRYDGSTHAITLQGILPFTGPNATTVVPAPQGNYLLNDQLFDRYWPLFNVSQTGDDMGRSFVPGRNDPQFVRQGFNVVHPFTSVNIVSEKISSKRVQKIHKVFQLSASSLVDFLTQTSDERNYSAVQNILGMFFSTAKEKFKTNKRIDALPGRENEFDFVKSRMDTNLGRIWQNVTYCNLVIEAILAESSLLTLTSEILAEKGALPVGEVGKTLTELTCIPSLSQKLKEKFGGLKKFLERFTDLFVFSNDHPFNPHVLLRYSVAPDQLEMIDRGLFPSNLLMKTKKPTPRLMPSNPLTLKKPDGTPMPSQSGSPYLANPPSGASIGGSSNASTPSSYYSQGNQGGGFQSVSQSSKSPFGGNVYNAGVAGGGVGSNFFSSMQQQQQQSSLPPQSKVIGRSSSAGAISGGGGGGGGSGGVGSSWNSIAEGFGDGGYFNDDDGGGSYFSANFGSSLSQKSGGSGRLMDDFGFGGEQAMGSVGGGGGMNNMGRQNIMGNKFNSGVMSQQQQQQQQQIPMKQSMSSSNQFYGGFSNSSANQRQQQQQQQQLYQQQLYAPQQTSGNRGSSTGMYGQQQQQQQLHQSQQSMSKNSQQQQFLQQQQNRPGYYYGSSNSSVNSDT